MAQISSTTGLVSGIDSGSIIQQLIAFESRPKNQIENRNTVLQSQQTALQEVNAQLLGVASAANRFASDDAFEATTATSSNEQVAAVSSGTGALPGNYQFTVAQLVSSQQTITDGFVDAATASVAPEGGLLTFNRGEARLDRETLLSDLNGGEGVNRGLIRVTDRSGQTSLVDLSAVVTLNDVVDKINETTAVNVFAEIDGDRLKISDASGQNRTALRIQDVGTSLTATGLGITGNAGNGTLTGQAINTVGRETFLSSLNDGNGVRTRNGVNDLRVTTRSGATHDLDVSGFNTLDELFNHVEEATEGQVRVEVSGNGNSLRLIDTTAGEETTRVEALNDSRAAADLGLLKSDTNGDGDVAGDRVISSINSKLLSSLRGGQGLLAFGGDASVTVTPDTELVNLFQGAGLATNGTNQADLRIGAKDALLGLTTDIDLDGLTTVQDLIDRVGSATNNKVTLSLDDDRLTLTDNTGGTNNLTVADLNGATAATQLGLVTDSDVATVEGEDLDAVAVGQQGARLLITNSRGEAGSVNLAGAESVDDLISRINNADLGVNASLNSAGTGLQLLDTARGNGPLVVADDDGGILANQLGLAGSFDEGLADGGDLGFQFVNEGTRLDALGIARGVFTIQDSDGRTATVDLTQGNENTVADVIGEINSRGLAVTARVNDTGDGLLLEDTGSGAVDLVITDDGSTTAADLNLAGTFAAGGPIDGAYRRTVEVTATDTLQSLALKINDANVGVSASVINDGSPGAPFRLALSADNAGSDGAFTFDDGGLGFGASNLAKARDAVVFYGGDEPQDALLVTSKSNTLDQLIPGVTVDLLTTSDQPVQITVAEDREPLTSGIQDFVSSFNGLIEKINEFDAYDAETQERGLLLGDPTIARVRTTIYNAVIGSNGDLTGRYDALSEIGIKVGQGAKLTFDQERFAEALATDPEAVRDLLTFEQFEVDPITGEDTATVAARGVGIELNALLKDLTDSVDGPLQRQVDILQRQIEANNDRIERVDSRIEDKRARLEKQFADLELTLAGLQDSSSALAGLNPVQGPS